MRLRDFQVDINKNLNRNLKKVAEIFADVSGSLQSPRARALFTSALEFVKPHHLALGLRVSRLSTSKIEVVIPDRWKNQVEGGEVDPGILTTTATMGAQLLLRRMDIPDLGPLFLEEVHLIRLSRLVGELRGRMELSKVAQEAFRAELKKKSDTKLELLMIFYDGFDKRLADCQLTYHCKAVSSLEWKDHNERAQQ